MAVSPRTCVMATEHDGRRPLIEVLYILDCPHYAGVLGLVERVREELGIDAELRTSLIGDQAAAECARFPGSPTIRVDGRDVEPGGPAPGVSSLACRLYRHEHGLAGQPAERWLAVTGTQRPLGSAPVRTRSGPSIRNRTFPSFPSSNSSLGIRCTRA